MLKLVCPVCGAGVPETTVYSVVGRHARHQHGYCASCETVLVRVPDVEDDGWKVKSLSPTRGRG